ncbi:Actin-related protein 4 [Nakaseomyces bracarensis]|uniref:Actin-related protein 4 n=1 Tax=Nakaseomyces bracarensis TaxID=273131 RepID=A0ABR4NZ55_9SACH
MASSNLQVYGGDEITAIVIDPGSYTTNIGYSGTDCPQSVLPSCYGLQEEKEKDNTESKKVFQEQAIGIPRPNYEIKRTVENGCVIDWDIATEQWEWSLKNELYLKSNKGIPALLTEPLWNSKENRAKSLEILLEKMDFEACYLAPTSTCVSFAAGRPNCIVVDIGHDVTSVTPVVDGMSLSKSTRCNHIAGKYLNHLLENFLKPRDIIPLFKIKQRKPELKEKDFDYSIATSLIDYANERGFLQECKETIFQMQPNSENDEKDSSSTLVGRSIETPWNEVLNFENNDRYSITEQLINPVKEDIPEGWPVHVDGVVETWRNDYVPTKRNKVNGNSKEKIGTKESTPIDSNTTTPVPEPSDNANENGKRTLEDSELLKKEIPGIVDLICSSISSCDVDIRASLAHNIVVTGGTSVIPGLCDRLLNELNKKFPALKFRVLNSGHQRERQYQAWLGGSILSSLGTFHQLWVGRKEYEEVGSERLLHDRFR